jgi:hypothetical protein
MLSDLTRDCTVYFQNFLVEIVVNETLSYVLSYLRKIADLVFGFAGGELPAAASKQSKEVACQNCVRYVP